MKARRLMSTLKPKNMYGFEQLYQQIERLKTQEDDALQTDPLQSGITADYYAQVERAADALLTFGEKYLGDRSVRTAACEMAQSERADIVSMLVLVDVVRCYDGLNHPTSFNVPEGVALMLVLDKVLATGRVSGYSALAHTSASALALIDIVPYLGGCSAELGDEDELCVSRILESINPQADHLYRLLVYNLCKRIAEADGEISAAEEDWLREIARLNDDDTANDIDLSLL